MTLSDAQLTPATMTERICRGITLSKGFVGNFCAPAPVKMPESGDSNRTAMVQPNVYWTLMTVPRPQQPYSKGNQFLDYFELDWRARKYVPNTL